MTNSPALALVSACLFFGPTAADRGDGSRPKLARAAVQEGTRDDPDPGTTFDPDGEALRAALDRGLEYLAGQQELARDGSFPAGEREKWSPVGITSLCVLAFLASGHTTTRGPYQSQVDAAIRYLLQRVSRGDATDPGYIRDEADNSSNMHGHGLATLALAEAYGMSPTQGEEIAAALVAAVACIERSQSSEGGWYYRPVASSAHEGSVTVCVLQALRAAKGAGIVVDSQRIGHAIDYLKRLQQENGAFAYTLGTPDRTSVALTAAGLSTFHATGIYSGKEVEEAYDWLWRELASREEAQRSGDRSLDPPKPIYERF